MRRVGIPWGELGGWEGSLSNNGTPPRLWIVKGLLSRVPQLGRETAFLFMCLGWGGGAVLVVEHLPCMHKVLFDPQHWGEKSQVFSV